jgi:DNL zinc finger
MTIYTNEEARRKAELSRREAENLIERELRCPECGYKAGSVFSDCTGHLTIRCRKCKTVSVLNLAYFRRHRRRRRMYPPRYKKYRTTE